MIINKYKAADFMEPVIETIEKKQLIGISLKMSLARDTTHDLFSRFMPRRGEIVNTVNTAVYDLRDYPPGYYLNFNPVNTFRKWALMEVTAFSYVPEQMQKYILDGGEYAVFKNRVKSAEFELFEYIFLKWLPNSDYVLDSRPHFDKLEGIGKEKNAFDSESIYIPVNQKY